MQTGRKRCLYHITVQNGKSVKIDFPVFSFPNSSNCYQGYVKIYEEKVGYGNMKAMFCGYGSKTFISYSNKVIVEFQSNSYLNKRFYANYSTVNKGI